MEIRDAMRMIEEELGKRSPLKAEWKEQIPEFLHAYKKDISLPDCIVEDEWNSRFMLKLSELSKKYADELEEEFGKYEKGFVGGGLAYKLNLSQAPPIRIFALTTILTAWLGWILVTHNRPISPDNAKQKLEEAFEFGRNLALRNERP